MLYIAGTSHGAPNARSPPCVLTGSADGRYVPSALIPCIVSTHAPPRDRGARPTASTARTKQMGKQSYSPHQSMSDGVSCASE
eukprot:6186512-Pleurochrysis_carterae.AAC.3